MTDPRPTPEENEAGWSRAIRAAFDSYPQPKPDAAFDARFWRALPARRARYRGVGGFLRRLLEVEIEGVAVWRLGASMLGGAAFCAVGMGICGARVSPLPPPDAAPVALAANRIPNAGPRFARSLPLDGARLQWRAPRFLYPTDKPKEVSCTRFANGLA